MTKELAFSAGFESYGTKVLFRSVNKAVLDEVVGVARSALLGNMRPCAEGPYPLVFDLVGSRDFYDVVRNGELITKGTSDAFSLRHLNALIRVCIGEFSPNMTFVHAGAVAWRGKAIVLPGMSFQGKSTLVYELVRLGAEYYSDDFAILDSKGLLHAFPRKLSMRTREDNYEIYEVDPAAIGRVAGGPPIPVGLIFLTRYRARARWKPEILSRGEGVFEVLSCTLPIRQRPDLTIQVLNRAATGAIIAKSDRGEAKTAARKLLEFFDNAAF